MNKVEFQLHLDVLDVMTIQQRKEWATHGFDYIRSGIPHNLRPPLVLETMSLEGLIYLFCDDY